jgi:hypothetical protein
VVVERRSIEAIIWALNAEGVRYLVVGGLAVVAHGYVRLTVDVDLVLDLDEGNLRRAVAALSRLGYRPLAPVAFEQFCDARARATWVREKGMTVFSLFSPEHEMTEVDLFVEAPLDFASAYRRIKVLGTRVGRAREGAAEAPGEAAARGQDRLAGGGPSRRPPSPGPGPEGRPQAAAMNPRREAGRGG